VSSEQILSQAEIDAIVNGVDSGAVSTEPAALPGETRSYDFNSQTRIVRGRMPTLEMINERFARLLRIGLYTLLRRSPEVSVSPINIKKFSEYMYSLHLPTNLNMVRIHPWRGMGLIVLDPKLVFAVVDQFFGGTGRHAKIEGREFTATEYRIIQMVLEGVFANLREAWSHVAAIEVEYVKAEINPHFASIVSPSEIVVISSFHIELDGAGGELHITMPYAMIEPLREVLDSGMASDRMDKDERWPASLREEIEYAEVELTTVLACASITVAELLNLKAGDILPCDFSGHVVVRAEDVPMFRGSFGVSGGQQAVKIEQRILERKSRRPPT
jgi:flagellar motor switch protein FliM